MTLPEGPKLTRSGTRERPLDGEALADYIQRFTMRLLQDALTEATASYWNRRARDFDAVGTPRADLIAQACRNKAALALIRDEPPLYVCEVCGTSTSPWSCSCGATRVDEGAPVWPSAPDAPVSLRGGGAA